MSQTTTSRIQYRIVSRCYMGGGELSTHYTLSGAERALRKHDAAISELNRHGGTSYHDCRIEELVDGDWQAIGGDE